jgi:hypothetical protein
MKQRPRTNSAKHGAKPVRRVWWTSKPAIAGAAICAIAAMILILLPQRPHAPMGLKNADVARATADADAQTTSPAAPTTVHASIESLPVIPPAGEPAPVAKAASVTIVGCLERLDDTFRLTHTAGADVPTSRSWKSGFLKKRPATIEVRDAARRVNLASHVGQRVSLTGALVDREMRVGSVQRVSSSCGSTDSSKIKI